MYRLPPNLLSWACASLFLGFAWKGIFFDFPFRELLWNEALLSSFLAALGVDWNWWVSADGINAYLAGIQGFFSLGFMLGFIAVVWKNMPFRLFWVCLALTLNVIVLMLGWPGHYFLFGYLLEIALRIGTPILWLRQQLGKSGRVNFLLARIFIAATFIGHGLYALNYYPRPFSFVNWTSAGLGLSESAAIQLLIVVGILDLIAAALLLLPKIKWAIPVAMVWLLPWATLTTLARYWANATYEEWSYLILRWTPEVLVRVPHILIVLSVWLAWRKVHQPT
ncbi:MAG: hypothetical protein AAGF87_11210 [Bacteroidota bacterium]